MKKILVIGLIIIVLVIGFSPWFTKATVEKYVSLRFNAKWQGVSDGCGQIKEFKDTKRIGFGFTTSIRYACGMLPTDAAMAGSWHTVYVSPFGSVHGL